MPLNLCAVGALVFLYGLAPSRIACLTYVPARITGDTYHQCGAGTS